MCGRILDNEKSGIRADINTMRIDNEFKNLIAPLSAEEYKQLEDSIMTEGCREPIILWQNIITAETYPQLTEYCLRRRRPLFWSSRRERTKSLAVD